MELLTLAENPFKEINVIMDSATHITKTVAWRRERTICRMMKWVFITVPDMFAFLNLKMV
jgi:hypothetical protein